MLPLGGAAALCVYIRYLGNGYLGFRPDGGSLLRSALVTFDWADGIDTESLLVNLSENLASADAMISDLAFDLKGSRRHVALGILQLIELSGMLANRALDNVNTQS